MNVVQRSVRAVGRSAEAATSVAGDLGGAAVNGVLGGLQGAAAGVKKGLGTDSNVAPAAALTLAAIGAVGLVDWPVVVAVGGTAVAIRRLNQRRTQPGAAQSATTARAQPRPTTARAATSTRATNSTRATKKSRPAKAAKSTKAAPRKAAARTRRTSGSR